jgi:murein DD-endopeptidase MepM/ murein hydrolase activator NlpD
MRRSEGRAWRALSFAQPRITVPNQHPQGGNVSFVMIASGPTSSASRVRTLSVHSLMFGGVLLALLLLGAGVGLGLWISAPGPQQPDAPKRALSSATPFALEQLGALSGRLFKLESQASQLSERVGAREGALPKEATPATAKHRGSGGPMLPPRPAAAAALEGLAALEARFALIEQQIALVADASARQHLALMRWPTRVPIDDAELTSLFGNREDPITGRRAFHAGLDFAAESGTPIHAAGAGTVAFAGFRSDFGWMVEIEHGNGLTTRYAHASRLLVKPKDLVTPGEVIAMSGSTGRSTGPHLHFEVLHNGEPADPRRYLAGL